MLRGLLSDKFFALSASDFELDDLAVFQITKSQSACSGDEDVEHCPAQAEATRLTRKRPITFVRRRTSSSERSSRFDERNRLR
jgi:hypothetical protein